MHVSIVFLAIHAHGMSQRTFQSGIKAFGILIARQRQVERRIILLPLAQRLLVEHLTIVTATVDLIDLGTVIQVHLGILRPCVRTKTGTIDRGQIVIFLILPHRCTDVHLSVERTVGRVVTTEEHVHTCLLTTIVHLGLIDIAGI